ERETPMTTGRIQGDLGEIQTASAGRIVVIVDYYLAHLRGTDSAWQGPLKAHLECGGTQFKASGKLGHQRSRILYRYYQVKGDDHLVIPSGAVPWAVEELRRLGYEVVVQDRRRFGARLVIDQEF